MYLLSRKFSSESVKLKLFLPFRNHGCENENFSRANECGDTFMVQAFLIVAATNEEISYKIDFPLKF